MKERKGISVLVSNVLMLLVVVVIASIVFAYVNFYVNDYQRGRGAALMERLLIEDVWFKGDHQRVNITIYNYGKISAKIIKVFIDSKDGDITSPPEGYIIIAVGAHEYIEVSFPWTESGVSHTIKLLTERGYSVEGDYATPAV